MEFLKTIAGLAVCVTVLGCAQDSCGIGSESQVSGRMGTMSVSIRHADDVSKAMAEYQPALDAELAGGRVELLVFAKDGGKLERSHIMESGEVTCSLDVLEGEKVIYAVMNGPDLSKVKYLADLLAMTDDLTGKNMGQDGLAMLGHDECVVTADVVAKPVIQVRWLASRVVLRTLTCNIARQYENMVVDCVYLGDANVRQTFSGEVSGRVNPGGHAYEGESSPIGIGNVFGACPDYMYRTVGETVNVGESTKYEYQLYCHPNSTSTYTSMYILVTIDGEKYYYRVPLYEGLQANHTYSVDATITNFGSELPPDGSIQKGEISATIEIAGWQSGTTYTENF